MNDAFRDLPGRTAGDRPRPQAARSGRALLRRVAATAAAVFVVAGCAVGGRMDERPVIKAPVPELQPFYSQRPEWRDCGDGFECARIEVPLDYAKPSGERIEISVIRLPATGDRIGSLLINPGGPGGSGIAYARAARAMFTARIRARFDIVGFDPRGVGESTPIRCMSSKELDSFIGLDANPDTAAEVVALEKGSKRFAERCAARSRRLLPYVGTEYAARDMDVIRAVLGDTGLTYLGKSYGTFLGAWYADLFPKQVRALVLDGAVNPAVPALKANEVQAKGFEVALRAFIRDALTQRDNPFRSRTVGGALAEIDALLTRADQHGLRNDLPDGRVVTESWAVLGIVTPLYDRDAWPRLRKALRSAFAGNGTELLRLADILVERRRDGSYANQTEANMAINCVDRPYPAKVDEYRKAAEKAAAAAPRFGAYVMWGSLPCAYWPVKPAATDPIRAVGAPPILVIGTTRDPATPYEWAKGLAATLASGVLLGYDGDGHTAYRAGSRCVDDIVDDYLISRRVPENGKVCAEA
jgi:pimeloyl-ACP methyl ester carboxylesterase